MFVDIYRTENKYKIIYADPPWLYKNMLSGRTSMGAIPYKCMTPEEMHKLPVPDIADRDCILFIWATMPKLQEALDTIKAWGFKYKTCAFCWVKQNPKSDGIYSGLGHWTNGNAELCLLATRGTPKRENKDVKQIVFAHRGRHSEKPAEVRERIMRLAGGGAKIELFARRHATGWDCWGDEVVADITKERR